MENFYNRDSICRARHQADPLSHPDIARMSLRELADLPIGHSWLPMQEKPAQGHFTSGGMLERIASILPPVLRPKIVPRS